MPTLPGSHHTHTQSVQDTCRILFFFNSPIFFFFFFKCQYFDETLWNTELLWDLQQHSSTFSTMSRQQEDPAPTRHTSYAIPPWLKIHKLLNRIVLPGEGSQCILQTDMIPGFKQMYVTCKLIRHCIASYSSAVNQWIKNTTETVTLNIKIANVYFLRFCHIPVKWSR